MCLRSARSAPFLTRNTPTIAAPKRSCHGRVMLLAGCLLMLAAAPAAGQLEWMKFGPKPFERARTEKKLVLVDVGIEGCTACQAMHTEVYPDAKVRQKLKQRFITVSVDADQEPD